MTPEQAKAWLALLRRMHVGRSRIERAERNLDITLLDAMRDPDLVIIFAEETKRQ